MIVFFSVSERKINVSFRYLRKYFDTKNFDSGSIAVFRVISRCISLLYYYTTILYIFTIKQSLVGGAGIFGDVKFLIDFKRNRTPTEEHQN